MSGSGRWTSTLAAVLALVLVPLAAPVASAADPEVPLPLYRASEPLPEGVELIEYEYPSVAFYWNELRWDSPKLEIEYLDDLFAHDEYEFGSEEHLLTAWRDESRRAGLAWEMLTDTEKQQAWSEFLGSYIGMSEYHNRGKAFEGLLDQLFGYASRLGYQYDRRLPGVDRRGDFFLTDADDDVPVVFIEAKSGFTLTRDQAAMYGMFVAAGSRGFYVFGMPPGATDVRYLAGLGIDAYLLPSRPVPVRHPNAPPPPPPPEPGSGPGGGSPTPPPAPAGPPGSLAAPGQVPVEIPVLEAIAATPSSPAATKAVQRTANVLARGFGYPNAAAADLTTNRLGGVDFSSLELRYVSDTYDGGLGTGNRYAYKVDAAPGEEVSFGGREAAQLAADSFFTWLALPPESFTVNLNPDEPGRIIDSDLGTTDAGRVLLEADLQMKKTVADLIHPDARQGARFWEALRGEQKCMSMRQWIVPRPAVVHERGNELFILDAPLEVKMETEYLESEGVATYDACRLQSSADTDFNEQVYRDMILPELEAAVNTAPEYADLRRVYVSRVAAEWYRQRSVGKTTAYSDLIDSGDVSAWPARVAWDPQEVYDRFLESYENGEFNVERTTVEGDYLVTHVYIYGGVDFTIVPDRELSVAEFASQRPNLGTAIEQSRYGPVAEEGTEVLWLGGQSAERPPWNPYPEPDPLRSPWFYVLTALPLLAWLVVGSLLLINYRRRHRNASPPRAPAGLAAS